MRRSIVCFSLLAFFRAGGSDGQSCIDYTQYIRVAASAPTSGSPYGLALEGEHLYIADGNGLRIADVSDPDHPVIVGSLPLPGYVIGIAVRASIAYLCLQQAGLAIVDVSNPSTPDLLSTVATPGSPTGVAVSGGRAYVADGPAGIQVIDVSVPTSPLLEAALPLGGWASEIILDASLAYVLSPHAGLYIIDVSAPDSLTLSGTLPVEGHFNSLAGVAFFGENVLTFYFQYEPSGGYSTRELWILDVSNPANPFVSRYVTIEESGSHPVVSGQRLSYLDGFDRLHVLDLVDPANPVAIASLGLPGYAESIAMDPGRVFVGVTQPGAIHVVDITSVSSPPILGRLSTGLQAQRIVCAGDTASAILFSPDRNPDDSYDDQFWEFAMLDLSMPEAPRRLGGLQLPNAGNDVAISDSYAYVCDGWFTPGGLQIIDISDPSRPRIVSSVPMPDNAQGIDVAGSYAYVADSWAGGFMVVDISDPLAPSIVAAVNTPGSAIDVLVDGSIAYFADGYHGDVFVFDVSSPTSPQLVGQIRLSSYTLRLSLEEDRLFVTRGEFVDILDVSDPSRPSLLGAIRTAQRGSAFVPDGRFGYLADGWAGTQVVDLSDITSAAIIGSAFAAGSADDIAMTGHSLCVAAGEAGILMLPKHCFAPTAVTLESFTVERARGSAIVRWSVAGHAGFVGFHVHRAIGAGSKVRLTNRMFAGSDSFEFIDDPAPIDDAAYWLEAVERNGTSRWFGPAELASALDASALSLRAEGPNPFRASTTLSFTLPARTHLSLSVYDVQGRKVSTLIDGAEDPGRRSVVWNGRMTNGEQAPSGLYWARLATPLGTRTARVVLAR